MSAQEFFSLIKESLKEIYGKPLIVLLSLVLWAVLFGVSKIGGSFAYDLTTTGGNVGWSIFVSIVAMLVISFIFSGMIGIVKSKKEMWKSLLDNSRKFVFRNFIVMLIILIITIAVFWVSFGLAFGIGRLFAMQPQTAAVVFALLYFIGLVGILIFFTFSSFYLVIENLKVGASLRKSFKLVGREYLATLSLLVILFVLGYLFNLIPGIYGELLIYLLLVPFVVTVMTKFVLREK